MQAWEYGLIFLAGGLLIVGGLVRTVEDIAAVLFATGMIFTIIPITRATVYWRKQDAEAKAALKMIQDSLTKK